jgi:hypothetical protein
MKSVARRATFMTKKLLWRAVLAFVLHCTPAAADHLSALLTGPSVCGTAACVAAGAEQ